MQRAIHEQGREFDGYTTFAVGLHWVIVLLLIVQYAIGWTMPDIRRDMQPETLINLHLSFGAVILALLLLRLVWRITHAVPPPPAGLPGWQNAASSAIHWLLYLLLILVPLLGWMNASARGWSITLFQVVPLFPLVEKGSSLGRSAGDIHVVLSYALLAAAGLHILGALYHRFVLRDEVLSRMLPGA
ncbi:cytochrome b [Azospirillum rugosum]|uniref:Cytochrome b561 n=1 Tax=Azospirillum rugosum TaxID=416170 RepID=A0ABS4SDT2_9PROT|nr:cytochrome b/b6 domain-containing protein [Azospirillum rugosum]MBP2290652.1 cytochrome b561 [Azospirillum rugosum]MDQ0525540.1 cytochrome b561 [Azospirillum rugosum]